MVLFSFITVVSRMLLYAVKSIAVVLGNTLTTAVERSRFLSGIIYVMFSVLSPEIKVLVFATPYLIGIMLDPLSCLNS